jgi:acetolactate synthase-1/2/3 large subunit
MKLSDVVAQFLAAEGIKTVFAVSGGASLHLIHSVAKTPGVNYVCPQHEQAGAMAADGYARMSGSIGCAIATSGPGATNLVTGIASSYYDSVPVLFLTGQVATFRAKGASGVRQIGFQETDIVDICRSITKYAVLLTDPYRVRYELTKAVYIAKTGRPGPVLVDIPDDLQRMDIDPTKLVEYVPTEEAESTAKTLSVEILQRCIEAIKQSKRPVLLFGWGIHLAKAEDAAQALASLLNIPIVTTWAARDIICDDNPLMLGGFGTHGNRHANFAVQNADLVISIGSRLDTKATGTPPSSFARAATLIMVDIDATEINKFDGLNLDIDIKVEADAKEFCLKLMAEMSAHTTPDIQVWREQTDAWKRKYSEPPLPRAAGGHVDPYRLMKILSAELEEGAVIFSDTGGSLAWAMQAFEFKLGQRFFHAFNNTPMGYGLPGAIGAAFATPNKRIILISGDGSLQMSIQELATVIRHKLPIKILLLNNHGHGMVRQTQDMWLSGDHYATSVEGGLADPDFKAIARAYGFRVNSVSQDLDLPSAMSDLLSDAEPAFLNIEIDPNCGVVPQVKFGRPNEDADPLLERDEFLSNMLIEPMPVSYTK